MLVVRGNTQFALELYRELAGQGGGENLFLSPYSVSVALAMTYAGARGETERQMAETLHFSPQDKLHSSFGWLAGGLGRACEVSGGAKQAFRFHVVNNLWAQEGYGLLQRFREILRGSYGAAPTLVDFVGDPEGVRCLINDAIAKQTEGRIPDLIPPGLIDKMVRLVLTNAVYFKANWIYPFEKDLTAEGPFRLVDGSAVAVPMMRLPDAVRLSYFRGSGYLAVELPYVGGRFVMLIIVPDEGQFQAFESGLDAERVAEIIGSLETVEAKVTMPKFRVASSFLLGQTLSEMGMPNAFTNAADFSGIDGRKWLYIADVVHKAFVAVDELGTEAAAATAVVFRGKSISTAVVVDRPFVHLIRDRQTGAVVFMGRVMNPVA